MTELHETACYSPVQNIAMTGRIPGTATSVRRARIGPSPSSLRTSGGRRRVPSRPRVPSPRARRRGWRRGALDGVPARQPHRARLGRDRRHRHRRPENAPPAEPAALEICPIATHRHRALLTPPRIAGRIAECPYGSILTGAREGSPVQFQPRYRPASGQTIKLTLQYEDKGKLVQVTRDYTVVGRLIEVGQITQVEADVLPRRPELHQAVGGRPYVYPDVYAGTLETGDWIAVCSYGSSNPVPAAALQWGLKAPRYSDRACRRILALSLLPGHHWSLPVAWLHRLPPHTPTQPTGRHAQPSTRRRFPTAERPRFDAAEIARRFFRVAAAPWSPPRTSVASASLLQRAPGCVSSAIDSRVEWQRKEGENTIALAAGLRVLAARKSM